ncbi:methylmalonyl-CoA mutase, large subunit, partial [mine drainage metagenome]
MNDSSSFWSEKLKKLDERNQTVDPAYATWKKKVLDKWRGDSQEKEYTNSSAIPVKEIYLPGDLGGDLGGRLGLPGVYPFTRGIYPDMYRGRYWTMRMFSGFGTPEDTNRRLKYLIQHGESGLSIAFDMPTLYGYDCNNERAEGEVGKCGVNVSTLKDMEVLFDGIDLGKVSTSMTINA